MLAAGEEETKRSLRGGCFAAAAAAKIVTSGENGAAAFVRIVNVRAFSHFLPSPTSLASTAIISHSLALATWKEEGGVGRKMKEYYKRKRERERDYYSYYCVRGLRTVAIVLALGEKKLKSAN